MNRMLGISLVTGMLSMMAACEQVSNPPLLFAQTETLGITIAGSTTDQGAELTLGYKSRDFAIIPVTVRHGDGSSTQVTADAGGGFQDALSVLGQFQANAEAQSPKVSLGKFFATGIAAQKLADGFRAELERSNPQ